MQIEQHPSTLIYLPIPIKWEKVSQWFKALQQPSTGLYDISYKSISIIEFISQNIYLTAEEPESPDYNDQMMILTALTRRFIKNFNRYFWIDKIIKGGKVYDFSACDSYVISLYCWAECKRLKFILFYSLLGKKQNAISSQILYNKNIPDETGFQNLNSYQTDVPHNSAGIGFLQNVEEHSAQVPTVFRKNYDFRSRQIQI